MKLSKPCSIARLAELTGATPSGSADLSITGLNEIHRVVKGDLTFTDHPKYYDKALQSSASVILINQPARCPEGKALLVSKDPFRDFNMLVSHFAAIADTEAAEKSIGEGSVVMAGAYVGDGVQIGKHCVISPGVYIGNHCVVGDHVIIQANSVIGSDAFYYKRRESGYDRLLSGGRVVIHDRVEIGAGCTIDRGVTGDTVIGQGTKLDNLVHIGHDTVIGRRCLFAAQVGIAGVVTVEDDVILWGQVGVQKDLTIGAGAVVLGQSGIAKSLQGNKTYFGSPVRDAREKMKELAQIKRLPELVELLNPTAGE